MNARLEASYTPVQIEWFDTEQAASIDLINASRANVKEDRSPLFDGELAEVQAIEHTLDEAANPEDRVYVASALTKVEIDRLASSVRSVYKVFDDLLNNNQAKHDL